MDKEPTPVNLGDKVKGEIQLPSIDVSQYVGRKTKIAKVEEFEGQYGYFVKMTSEVIDMPTLKDGKPMLDKEGNPIELRATRIFGLQTDSNGNIGWGADTKLAAYLAKFKVKHYRDLVGREAVVQTVLNKNDGKEYLTIA